MHGPRRMKGRKSTSQFVMARHVLPRKWSCFPQALLSSISIEPQFQQSQFLLGVPQAITNPLHAFDHYHALPLAKSYLSVDTFRCFRITEKEHYFLLRGGPRFYFKLKVDQNFNSLSQPSMHVKNRLSTFNSFPYHEY